MNTLPCIFCDIVSGHLPAKFIYRDDKIIVIHDAYPKAKVHALLMPQRHIQNFNHITQDDASIIAHMMMLIKHTAECLSLQDYTLISHNGTQSGQEIFHMHIHLLSSDYRTRLGE